MTGTKVFWVVRDIPARSMQYLAPGGIVPLMQSGVLVITPASLIWPTWISVSGVAITSAWEKRRVMVAGLAGLTASWSACA